MNEKNPLAVVLGVYLQNERKRSQKNIPEWSKEIFYSESAYRMIESGGTLPALVKCIPLLKLLPEKNLTFGSLSVFLVAAHALDHLIVLKNGDVRKGFAKLCTLLPEYERFLPYFEPGGDQKDFIEKKLLRELKIILKIIPSDPADHRLSENVMITKLLDMPSIQLDIILDQIKRFQNTPPLHVGRFATDWLKSVSKEITTYEGLFTRPDEILNETHMTEFWLPFLWEEQFESVRLIFISDESDEQIKEKFIHLLSQASKQYRKKLSDRERSLISIKTISPTSKMHEVRELTLSTEDWLTESSSFWQYSLEGFHIAFVGLFHHQFPQAANIRYGETRRRNTLFEKLWTS